MFLGNAIVLKHSNCEDLLVTYEKIKTYSSHRLKTPKWSPLSLRSATVRLTHLFVSIKIGLNSVRHIGMLYSKLVNPAAP